MVGLVIAFPGLVTNAFEKEKKIDIDKVRIELPPDQGPAIDATKGFDLPKQEQKDEVDPMKEIQRQLESGKK